MDGWFTISDFTPNLWVKSITASGPTLSINLADIVFIELAPFQSNHASVFIIGILGSQSSVTLWRPLRIIKVHQQ
jgi:hypothetical protein